MLSAMACCVWRWGVAPRLTPTSRQGLGHPQAWTYKKLGFPVPYLVVGRWGVTPFPAPTPMRFIVGEPLSAADAGSMVRRAPLIRALLLARACCCGCGLFRLLSWYGFHQPGT